METENAQPGLVELARRQWGVVTREQLMQSGLRTRGISDWVRSGRLVRLHRGIYAYGHDRLRVEGRWLAAVLACGPGAVLSHGSGAGLGLSVCRNIVEVLGGEMSVRSEVGKGTCFTL